MRSAFGRRSRLPRGFGITSVAVLILLNACGSDSAAPAVGGPASAGVESTSQGTSGTERAASSESWTGAADRFRSEKQQLDQGSVPGRSVQNSPDANYLSEPVDIVAPGEYVLEFPGVLPEHADLGYTLLAPPDVTFEHLVSNVEVVDSGNTSSVVLVTITIPESGFNEPYLGFRAWIV